MSQSGHDVKDGNAPTVPCPCGSIHPPNDKQLMREALDRAGKEVAAYIEAHGATDEAISAHTMVTGLCNGNASAVTQKAAGVMLIQAMTALTKLPKEIQELLINANVEIAGATVMNLGADGKAGTMPDIKVPGLSELLPKKAGNREDN